VIGSLIALHGGVTRAEVRNMILRLCMLGDERDHFDGDDAQEAGNHLINFYTALFVVSSEETILSPANAEETILEHYAKAYKSGAGGLMTLEDARETFVPNDTWTPFVSMPAELATKIGMALGAHEAQQARIFHEHHARERGRLVD
jgi:hypothetical protein